MVVTNGLLSTAGNMGVMGITVTLDALTTKTAFTVRLFQTGLTTSL